MKKFLSLPTLIASAIGLAGVLLLLFAWHLPPFAPAHPSTENAYLRGKVTQLAPQLPGTLSEVAVSDFQDVRAGDLIARIEPSTYRQKLAQAKASLDAARAAVDVAEQSVRSASASEQAAEAALAAAQSTLETAQTDAGRMTKLRERGVTSQSSADQTDLALRQAQAAVRQAEAQRQVSREATASARLQIAARKADVTSAEAAVELAQIDLDHTEIHAPADGRLGQVSAHVGQYVTAGTTLVSHVGTELWVIANIKETALAGLSADQPVRFTVDALGGRAFRGHVQGFSPAAASEFSLLAGSNATGNFTKIAQRLPVRISIDPGQDAAALRPGFSVEVEVETGAAG
ncbi:HlyD family secretion protein [Salipiger mangrovisoli]|uniref:HlyD family secretion protein n=1 Tax=Salipiger mangrovisoli TaxID=2865933 RepID=A0ABR9WX66_9RHOB|nr:HlyD family secretion protein [Salipiger mangrovisoli]MBE9635874.1 HlyD family secretion protein [Salipiger mangrovisoli]